MVRLSTHQLAAIESLRSGSILCGGVGSGKSRTALGYYFYKVCQGYVPLNGDKGDKELMKYPHDLYIITTAKKRDTFEWENECEAFSLFKDKSANFTNTAVYIDSWNNIKKYQNIVGAFFIFDEQRVVGSGAWVKAFLKIAKKNKWILLSATPGDTWTDYRPVFIANGFYKNKTDFNDQHVIWDRFAKFPKVNGYHNQGKLIKCRSQILVSLSDNRQTKRHNIVVPCEYDKDLYKRVWKDRWNIYDNEPIEETGKLFYLLRRVVNSDLSRQVEMTKLFEKIPRSIVFYNFNYELEILKGICELMMIPYAQWNGNVHESVPTGESWVYLVQYSAGAEGWNCIETDTIIFYSQNYSYRITEQAAGRIDRMNTEYKDLFYYHLKSTAPIDLAIRRALNNKRNFNESNFMKNTK